jgi:thioredoxin-like negative regulator of GroEL
VLGLAVVSKVQGKFSEAKGSLERLMQQDPKNYRLYIELADCFIRMGDTFKAVETLETFQRFGIRNSAVTEMMEKIRS